jgi:hypothetical protein
MSIKKNITVRLDDETRELLELISEREMRPLANQITFFARQAADEYLLKNDLLFKYQKDTETGELDGQLIPLKPPF